MSLFNSSNNNDSDDGKGDTTAGGSSLLMSAIFGAGNGGGKQQREDEETERDSRRSGIFDDDNAAGKKRERRREDNTEEYAPSRNSGDHVNEKDSTNKKQRVAMDGDGVDDVSIDRLLERRRQNASSKCVDGIVVPAPVPGRQRQGLPFDVQVQEIVDGFLESGVCVLRGAIRNRALLDETSAAADEILDVIRRTQPNIEWDTDDDRGRYREVAVRCKGRIDTRYKTASHPFDHDDVIRNAALLPVVQRLLGGTASVGDQRPSTTPKLVYAGLIYNFPKSDDQPWHQDGEPLFPELLAAPCTDDDRDGDDDSLVTPILPPYALNVFIPLTDDDAAIEAGPTEFVLGSHLLPEGVVMRMIEEHEHEQPNGSANDKEGSDTGDRDDGDEYVDGATGVIVSPVLQQGDVLVYDYRICHRGTTNVTHKVKRPVTTGETGRNSAGTAATTSSTDRGRVRRILYLMYARPWFKEHLNFGDKSLFSTDDDG